MGGTHVVGEEPGKQKPRRLLDALWGMYQWPDPAPKGRNETAPYRSRGDLQPDGAHSGEFTWNSRYNENRHPFPRNLCARNFLCDFANQTQ